MAQSSPEEDPFLGGPTVWAAAGVGLVLLVAAAVVIKRRGGATEFDDGAFDDGADGNPFADLTPDSNESTPSFADSGQTAAAGGAPAGRFGDSPAIDPAEATEPVPFGQTVAFDSGDPAESVAVVEPISAEESELIGATEPVPFGQPVDMGSELSDSASLVSSHAEERKPLEVPIVPEESGAEVGLLLKEIERRVAGIESRMDELTEGRERVERQVAAQTEELRVQRAAIARTQRAVRNMSRPDDAQATEPAPRDPRTS